MSPDTGIGTVSAHPERCVYDMPASSLSSFLNIIRSFSRGFASWVTHNVVGGAKFALLHSVAEDFRASILQLRYRQDRVRTAYARLFMGRGARFYI